MNRRSIEKNTEPSYDDLRSTLLLRGHSIRSFALQHGYNVQTAYDAARNRRAGKITSKIRRHLIHVTRA
jgi:hypothetical protein